MVPVYVLLLRLSKLSTRTKVEIPTFEMHSERPHSKRSYRVRHANTTARKHPDLYVSKHFKYLPFLMPKTESFSEVVLSVLEDSDWMETLLIKAIPLLQLNAADRGRRSPFVDKMLHVWSLTVCTVTLALLPTFVIPFNCSCVEFRPVYWIVDVIFCKITSLDTHVHTPWNKYKVNTLWNQSLVLTTFFVAGKSTSCCQENP